jgi:alanine racemase
VGYGATLTLARDSRIGIVGIGYADGFFRALSASNQKAGARMVVRNRFVPVIGRVSMDMTLIDLTDLGADLPAAGEMAEVLGPNIPVDELGDIAGTIGYEILTGLKGRYSRSYIGL